MSKYLRRFEESKINYDCVIISDENLPKGYPRLLSTDQVLVLPTYVSIRLLVTSIDVIHSWALPSHGIKMDAIPGRVNQINFLVQTVGTYWGQCSELCGINHGFMPVEVRVLPLDDYLTYIALNISFRQDKLLLVVEKFFEAYILRENKKFMEKIIMSSIEGNIIDEIPVYLEEKTKQDFNAKKSFVKHLIAMSSNMDFDAIIKVVKFRSTYLNKSVELPKNIIEYKRSIEILSNMDFDAIIKVINFENVYLSKNLDFSKIINFMNKKLD